MHSYNDQYKAVASKEYQFSPNDSLGEFFELYKNKFLPNLNVSSSLEIGCGLGLHINATNSHWEIEGLDISPVACAELSQRSGHNIFVSDFLNFSHNKKWDLVLDAHLLHCLIGKDQFERYFEKVLNILNSGGHLLLEVMCSSKGMMFDSTQFYDQPSQVLYENDMPVRTILHSSEIEKLILSLGLKIVYLRVDETIKFIPNSHRGESRPTDPDRMRIICLKE